MRKLINAILIFGILVMFARGAEANCKTPMKVESGMTVECTGVLLSDNQFIEASNTKKELRLKDLKIAEYKNLGELYDLRHKHYSDELKESRNELKWLQIKSGIGYVISFSLGAVITGVIAKEVLK